MIVIVGCIVVIGAVLGGFTMAGGHVHALIHPSEIVTIGGAAMGALIVMSPKQVLIDLVKGMIQAIKGSPYGKKAYAELFGALYELFRMARREGMLVLEPHLNDPHQSRIFNNYPTLAKNHHAIELICESLKMVVDGTVNPEQMPQLFEAELKAIEEEHHGPLNVLSKTADGLPGFGIVAAVLGIVITMGAIDGPVEEIGHKVGAALVGTFLGILLSYGFFAPLAVKMEFVGIAEMAFFRAIAEAISSFVDNVQPKIAIERARRGLGRDVRPTAEELEEVFKAAEAGDRG
jgi:chemotaxis protein MotA